MLKRRDLDRDEALKVLVKKQDRIKTQVLDQVSAKAQRKMASLKEKLDSAPESEKASIESLISHEQKTLEAKMQDLETRFEAEKEKAIFELSDKFNHNSVTEAEHRLHKREHTDRLKQRLAEQKNQLVAEREQTGVQFAPQISEKDLEFLATTRVRLTQADILSMYVGNWKDLNLKQRRKVMAYVQAQRSKQAKEIFLKELSALGRKMAQQKQAAVDHPRIQGVKDIHKLKIHKIRADTTGAKDPLKQRLE